MIRPNDALRHHNIIRKISVDELWSAWWGVFILAARSAAAHARSSPQVYASSEATRKEE
jgi:hypothetical protein